MTPKIPVAFPIKTFPVTVKKQGEGLQETYIPPRSPVGKAFAFDVNALPVIVADPLFSIESPLLILELMVFLSTVIEEEALEIPMVFPVIVFSASVTSEAEVRLTPMLLDLTVNPEIPILLSPLPIVIALLDELVACIIVTSRPAPCRVTKLFMVMFS
jgi:hypothetical protein